jgi:acetyl esterase/lipase
MYWLMMRSSKRAPASLAPSPAFCREPPFGQPWLLGSYLPRAPWPWGLVDFAAQALKPAPGTVRATIRLPHCTAQMIRAAGVLPADNSRRIMLYIHGGAFMTGGTNTHGRLVSMLSKYADTPVLFVNYRTMPKHSIGDAVDDCYDGY